MKLELNILVIFAALILSGCSTKLQQLRYNPDTASYEASVVKDSTKSSKLEAWQSIRDPESFEKIKNISYARRLVDTYNSGTGKSPLLRDKTSFSRQYAAGKYYFSGAKNIKSGNTRNALANFREAMNSNPTLLYTSDIAYLIGQCHEAEGNLNLANKAYNQFKKFSDAVCPESFYLERANNDSLYKLIFSRANFNNPEVQALHFANKYKGPALKSRNYPGLIRSKPYVNLFVDVFRDVNGDALLGGGIEATSLARLKSTWSFSEVHRLFSLTYQLYRSFDNRFGLTGSTFSKKEKTDIEGVDISQWGFNMTTGYFVHPRVGFYLGYDYNVWNKNNPKQITANDIKYEVWHENRAFGGLSFLILDFLGVGAHYDNINQFQISIYLNSSNLLLF